MADEEDKIFPLPLKMYPRAAEGVIICTGERSVQNFKNYVPFNENGPLTKWFVDHLHPNFVAREFVLGSKFEKIKVPECMKEELEMAGIYPEGEVDVDVSTQELTLLEVMGYTRWDEVRECVKHKKHFVESLAPSKEYLLRHLGIID